MGDLTILELQRLLEILLTQVEQLKLYVARVEQAARDGRANV